jgi:hypothetical protein
VAKYLEMLVCQMAKKGGMISGNQDDYTGDRLIGREIIS